MNTITPTRTTAHPTRSTILIVLAVASAVITGALGYQSLAAPSASAPHDPGARLSPATPAPGARQAGDVRRRPPRGHARGHHPPPGDRLDGAPRWAPGEADGAVPDGVTVFDDDIPAVANLDPALLGVLRHAATDAAGDGITFTVTSGWRSPAYQNQLLREAVAAYGSAEEAARWVATADTSAHVSGDAIDLGPVETTAWLTEHGAQYGLCQIYRNEPWHFELRPEAVDQGCPPMYADPTHDPRMQP